MVLNSLGIGQRGAYEKLEDYQLKNTRKSIKLFKMTFMYMAACHAKEMLKKLYKEQISYNWR